MEKNIFMQKQFWKIFFQKKKMFLNFLSQKVTNFCSKKKMKKKQKKTKKNIPGNSLKKKKYFGIFVSKKYFLGA